VHRVRREIGTLPRELRNTSPSFSANEKLSHSLGSAQPAPLDAFSGVLSPSLRRPTPEHDRIQLKLTIHPYKYTPGTPLHSQFSSSPFKGLPRCDWNAAHRLFKIFYKKKRSFRKTRRFSTGSPPRSFLLILVFSVRPQVRRVWISWAECLSTGDLCQITSGVGLSSWPWWESDPATFPANSSSPTDVFPKFWHGSTRQAQSNQDPLEEAKQR